MLISVSVKKLSMFHLHNYQTLNRPTEQMTPVPAIIEYDKSC